MNGREKCGAKGHSGFSTKEMALNQDFLNLAASVVFLQAEDGVAVPVDPELADALGAFPEE